MKKLDQLGTDLGIDQAFEDSADMLLDKKGMLFYIPPETPVDEIREEDIDTVALYSFGSMIREVFSKERNMMRGVIEEHIRNLKTTDDESVRLSEDYVPDISEENIDELTIAYLEDEYDGFDESDEEGSGQSTSGGEEVA